MTLFEEHGIGFVVYKADLTYKKGAQFGDHVRIDTTVEKESAFRLIFQDKLRNSIQTTLFSSMV